jgi:peptide/nickel transport system substrate-binding protein
MLGRRNLLAGAALAAPFSAPRLARAQAGKTLRYVPGADLSTMDPIWSTSFLVRTASLMVYDMLYGVDHSYTPRPQMVEAHEASPDMKTWTSRLRPGLRFHDGEPVRSGDVVASLTRWMARDGMGGRIRDSLDVLEAVDDRSFRFRLNKPFPKMLFALGKGSTPCAFIMPERIARTDPFRQVTEFVGSGPMRFQRGEWVPGSQAVFTRFEDYIPRDEPADWLSGGKRMQVDRVEWKIITDTATAAAALQNGEVDWLETPLTDFIPLFKRNPALRAEVTDPAGAIGVMRLNHLQPPFTDVRVRRAVQMSVDQTEFMQAVAGTDPALWQTLPSFFPPFSPGYNEEGSEPLKGRPKAAEARRLLAEAGYKGEPIVLLGAAEVPIFKAMADLTDQALKRVGMNVDYVATDFGSLNQRIQKKDPAAQGGWHLFNTWTAGADCVTPATYRALFATGDRAWFGWPDSALVRQAAEDWYDAPDPAAEKRAFAALNRASMENVSFVPTGFFKAYQAWRADVSGIPVSPYITFWNVTKR